MFGFYIIPFYIISSFGIGFLIGIFLNTVFKRFKITSKIRISPFLIGFWGTFFGAYLSSDYLHIPGKVHLIIDRIIIFCLIFIPFYILSDIIGKTIELYIESKNNKAPSSILKNSIVVFGSIIGLFIALQTIGISITPLITTLGVGTVVIGLALQDTLSNFFSGFYILVSKNIRVGDYIKFDVYEGYVKDINWRVTHIKTLSGNVIVVPNSKLTSSVITNYHLPEKISVVFSFSVGYKEDLERVEKLLIEIAKEVLNKLEAADKSHEPIVRYRSFGSSGIDLILVVRVKEFLDQYLIVHEFIKAIKKRFEEENIEIPYQTINVIIKNET
ncbi:MAG: mechanosensitive ion channel family protein [Hydrogenobaculum sp.]